MQPAGSRIPIQPTHADNAFDNVDEQPRSQRGDRHVGWVEQYRFKIFATRSNEQGVQGNQLNANQIDSWRRQVYEAASTPIDGKIAAQIGDNLGGVL